MKPHKKTLLAAACATGLLLMLERCEFPTEPNITFGPDVCEELKDGGVLDCVGNGSSHCELELNGCTYYKLGKYRILVDLDEGTVYQRPRIVENYDEHSPVRKETESTVNLTPPSPDFRRPYLVESLFGAVRLRVSIFDTETKKWAYSDFAMYLALVSPEVTYENTVWGKLRKQGDSTYYAWHVVPRESYEAYKKAHENFKGRRIEDWDPEKPIDWQPGEKEAHDALAQEVSLSLPLAGGYETYGLGFTFGVHYRLGAAFLYPRQDPRTLRYNYESHKDTLKFNIRER